MKKLVITIVTLVAISLTTVAYADIKVYNNGTEGRVINRSTDGDFLTYFDNYKVYNFVKDINNDNGTVTRLWQPKKDLVKITDYNSYLKASIGVNVYDFDDVGNQLPSTFKFKEHRYLGEFNINSKTIYRFWK